MIKDQETLEQKALCVVSPLSLDNLFSSETLASIRLLSLSVLVSTDFLGESSAASHQSQG